MPINQQTGEGVTTVDQAILTSDVLTRLQSVRQEYLQGRYSEETQESKRLLFARWLVQNGKLRR